MLYQYPENISCPTIVTINRQLKQGDDTSIDSLDSDVQLSRAVETNNIECMKVALANGANVNAKGLSDSTLLNTACYNYAFNCGKYNVIETLLEHGADPNQANTEGWTPLHSAIQLESLDLAKRLIQHGARIDRLCDAEELSIKKMAGERFEELEKYSQAIQKKIVKNKVRL